MNKTKKELYQENIRLKKERKLYKQFWEVDLLLEQDKQLSFIKQFIWVIAIILLCVSFFLIGIMVS